MYILGPISKWGRDSFYACAFMLMNILTAHIRLISRLYHPLVLTLTVRVLICPTMPILAFILILWPNTSLYLPLGAFFLFLVVVCVLYVSSLLLVYCRVFLSGFRRCCEVFNALCFCL